MGGIEEHSGAREATGAGHLNCLIKMLAMQLSKRRKSELPEVAVHQLDVQNTNRQIPELNIHRYPQRIRQLPDCY